MSQLSLPEIQSNLNLLLDIGKTIIALRGADPENYISIIEEFYESHEIASDDEIINRVNDISGMISKAFECSSAAKSILDMGPVLDSYLKNQEAKKSQKKTPPATVTVAAVEPEKEPETVSAKKSKSKSTPAPTSMDSLNLKPSVIKILKLFVDGKKMHLIKDVSGFTESDVYQNFTSEYWKLIEQEWSPEAVKPLTKLNLTNCSVPKNLLFGLNTMVNEQNIAINTSKFATLGITPTYEHTALYQAIQNAANQTSSASKRSGARQKTTAQTTPTVVQRCASTVIEAPDAPVIPTVPRNQSVVETTPEPQPVESNEEYENLDGNVISIEEFDSMDEQDFTDPADEPIAELIEEPKVEEPKIEEPISQKQRRPRATITASNGITAMRTPRPRITGTSRPSERAIRRPSN